jgi:hypothetical protein
LEYIGYGKVAPAALSNKAGVGAGAGAAEGDSTNAHTPKATNTAPNAMLMIEVLSFIFFLRPEFRGYVLRRN